MHFENYYFNNFVSKCKIEYQKKKKKKKKKATEVFQNFGSVGKGQTNIFFFFFRPNLFVILWKTLSNLFYRIVWVWNAGVTHLMLFEIHLHNGVYKITQWALSINFQKKFIVLITMCINVNVTFSMITGPRRYSLGIPIFFILHCCIPGLTLNTNSCIP